MLTIDSKQRIIWKEIFENNLFKDELPKYLTAEGKNYNEYIEIFNDYVKTNIIKSYLRFHMTEVDFKEDTEPT